MKFTRIHERGVAQGTGLGLAICKGIVEAHGGRIWAESPSEGMGATFNFTLPVAASIVAAPLSDGPRASGALNAETENDRKDRILVVDDEPRIIRVLMRTLSRAGYEVAGTTEPSEAVEMVEASRPDLILLDIAMPGMNGFELLERIQKISDVPAVFLTASYGEKDRKRARDLGAKAYLTKPFSPPEVISRIESILRSPVEGIAGADGCSRTQGHPYENSRSP